MRTLQQAGYLKEVSIRSTKAGFGAVEYELTARSYLAMLLDSISLGDLLNRVDEEIASEVLAAIAALT